MVFLPESALPDLNNRPADVPGVQHAGRTLAGAGISLDMMGPVK
jgi:hypothetical protein